MKTHRLSVGYIAVIVLLVIHLLPIWIFRHPSTQDGPVHVHNAYVLKEYHKHENYILREVYKRNPTLFPNWTSHVFMALLMYVFPPVVCEKILFSVCVAFLPLSLFYFLNGVQKGKTLFGLVGFIFAYNYLLHMGFYNFALSVPMFFFTLGYWWRHRENLSVASVGVMYILLLGVYFTHFQSYALLVLSLTFFGIFLSFYEALQKTWGYRKKSEADGETLISGLKRFAVALKPALLFLGSMLPAYFIMMSYYLAKTGRGGYHRSFEGLKNYFFSVGSIVSFRDDHILIGRILLIFLAVAFLLTIIDRIRRVYNFRRSSGSEGAKERLWTKIVSKSDQFPLMAAILTIIYFRSPWMLRSGGMWISDRIHIYILLVLLPFFIVSFHRYMRYAMAGIIIALSLWHLSYHVQTYYFMNKDVDNAISSAGMIEKNTVLTSRPESWGGVPDSPGWKMKYIVPFEWIEGYMALENGVAYLENYEPGTDHFPLKYKNRDLPPDYILVWRTEYDNVEDLEDDFEVIHTSNYNRLYRRKKAKPDEELWGGKTMVEFDMQHHQGQTAPGHIPIYKDTAYIDGRYGWITRSIRDELPSRRRGGEIIYWDPPDMKWEGDEFRNKSGIPEPYKDSVWGEEDGVFRVALPNGSYEVACYFCSAGSEPLEINLIANGEKKIKKLRLSRGNEIVKKSYSITITDERLTQIIYTRRKGSYKRWGWSGFAIKRTR